MEVDQKTQNTHTVLMRGLCVAGFQQACLFWDQFLTVQHWGHAQHWDCFCTYFLSNPELRTLTDISIWCQTGPQHLLLSQLGRRPLPAVDEQPRTVCVFLPQKVSCFIQFIPVQNKHDDFYFNSNDSNLDLFSTIISTVRCKVGLIIFHFHFSSSSVT